MMRRCVGVGAAAAGTLYARSSVARANETAEVPREAPAPPGIYTKGSFDPTAIEQVAAASKTSKAMLGTAAAAAKDKQKEERELMSRFEARNKQLVAEARDARRREDDKTRREQSQHEAERSHFRSNLAHDRGQAAMKLEETLKDGEESSRVAHDERMETIRRETAAFEANLRREGDAKYVAARASADAAVERDTHDLKLAMLREQGKMARDAAVEATGAVLRSAGAAFSALLGDEKRMVSFAAVVTAAALGVAVARRSTGIVARSIEARLRKPALVRETSRGFGGIAPLARLLAPKRASGAEIREEILRGAAFEPALEATLLRIATGAANTRANGAPFRHCLLHGPPGTGKTLFAKRLATRAGLDYAVASGGDIAPLGRDAVTQIHKLFDWSATSPNGLVLLIDEADAFVRTRSNKDMSEDARNALNAFLYRTGSPTKDVLVVFATNAPELFDAAIHDRVDDVVRFDKPRLQERVKILNHHLETFAAADAALAVDGITADVVSAAAEKVDGFSARAVSKLALAWRAAAFASETPRLTSELVGEVTQSQLEQEALKAKWHDAALAKKSRK
ncbi:P-loop containing nucleoside triphosphate hydrolase protein [Pelagophyceae sp. CCMP2097]|nr:P-loop containing nucleoside triphosphate hydrolase protein [Pelagophyceae sp. CCMP2097]|mmetsp:Transcript_10247/g.36094  ORF Transcript_10247/g.36094 Transcript_10247/m.36094 type:complete len:570 (-) Transcript_10247:69-1778(-)